MATRPSIHLWIYNHFLETYFIDGEESTRRLKFRSFTGISDQLHYFISSFKQHGYEVTIGKQPSTSALNVVIENFSAQTRNILATFCQATNKRVAVILTEHMEFRNNSVQFHGSQILNENDYMNPVTQLSRIRYLIDCAPYIRCFFVLGDLPEIKNIATMLPGIDLRTIPFPKIDFCPDNTNLVPMSLHNEMVFFGAKTHHRSRILSMLVDNGFAVGWPEKNISRKRRDLMCRSSKINLSIPQREGWKWLSLMRNIAALRSGRATVSLGTNDTSRISDCTYQLDTYNSDWLELLQMYVQDWFSSYQVAFENYNSLVERYEALHNFPHDMLEFWSITDSISQ
jgi:hypothetical protein